jgi:hypothetical protein
MSRPVDPLSRLAGWAGHKPRPCLGAERIVGGEGTPGEPRPAGGSCSRVRILTRAPGAARGTYERRPLRELAWGSSSRALTVRSVLHDAVRATKAALVRTRNLVPPAL